MKQQNWVNWLQISSNMAVLIGVILVVLQLGQDADLTEFQILKQEADNYVEAEMALANSDYPRIWAKMIEEPQNLTLAEQRAIDGNLWAHVLVRWRNLYKFYERGLLDESAWKQLVNDDLDFELAHPYGRAYWQSVRGDGSFPRELVNLIDERLAEAPYNQQLLGKRNMLQRVRQIQTENEEGLDQSRDDAVQP